jgi:hypothetical protein
MVHRRRRRQVRAGRLEAGRRFHLLNGREVFRPKTDVLLANFVLHICGKYHDYLCVDILPPNFFVLFCPPNLFALFSLQIS